MHSSSVNILLTGIIIFQLLMQFSVGKVNAMVFAHKFVHTEKLG